MAIHGTEMMQAFNTQANQMQLAAQANRMHQSVSTGGETSATTERGANAPADASKISGEARTEGTEKPANPYQGISDNFSTVTVDPWKKGKNDTIEGMLRNQGYSLKDIYSKDKNGQTLIDQVAKANNLKNPNLIQDGAELKIPKKGDSASISSADRSIAEDMAHSSDVTNQDAGTTVSSAIFKPTDGSAQAIGDVDNKSNPDANLRTYNGVGKDGRIDSNAASVPGGVESHAVSQNSNGSAVSEQRLEGNANGSSASIKDLDRKKDLSGSANADSVGVTNPGRNGAEGVTSRIKYSEKSDDGSLEKAGAWLNDKVGALLGAEKPAPQAPVNFQGAGQINVTRDQEGAATVSSIKNGNSSTLLQTAGDRDDSLLERAGEWGDERLGDVKQLAGQVWEGMKAQEAGKQAGR
jgi:hypothetical protein